MYMSNSSDHSKEQKEVSYDLSEELNIEHNQKLYNIIDRAYKIVMNDNTESPDAFKNIHGSEIINMIITTVLPGTINVYKKLQELENNNELIMTNTNNILYDIEYVKFIKAKLFSKIIDNAESRLNRDYLTDLATREHNGNNIKSRLALVNFQSEIIDLYERKGKGEKGDDAVNYKTLKEEEGEEGGKEKRGEEKRGGKRSRKSRKTKTAKKSRRTRRRRRN